MNKVLLCIASLNISVTRRLASVAGAVIQAIRRLEFEDVLRTGDQLEVSNGLQSVRTNPVVNAKAHMRRSLTLVEVYPSGDC